MLYNLNWQNRSAKKLSLTERFTDMAIGTQLTIVRWGTDLENTIEERREAGRERGVITIEQILWAVAIIAIVAIGTVAISGYITTQAGKLK